ncbi:uncharacterized protein LOC121880468 [Homarus americanus]|uniref:uncharacterized protein LOC121880468 n=1 Tax=Homarus americanus TaxID=6706 RepID=UPI001C476E11|nr:uncharacterized protein LOC121880468 [Homarus americanus]
MIIDLHRTVGQLETEDGRRLFFNSKQCYLYGICLKDVELWHILSIGLDVEYDEGRRGVNSVWIGQPLESTELRLAIENWCDENNVPSSSTEALFDLLILKATEKCAVGIGYNKTMQ